MIIPLLLQSTCRYGLFFFLPFSLFFYLSGRSVKNQALTGLISPLTAYNESHLYSHAKACVFLIVAACHLFFFFFLTPQVLLVLNSERLPPAIPLSISGSIYANSVKTR